MRSEAASVIYDLLETISTLVHAYEEQHDPMPDGDPVDVLQSLMHDHQLTRQDLPAIGTPGVVSAVLRRKRSLNVRMITALAARFGVSPAVFF